MIEKRLESARRLLNRHRLGALLVFGVELIHMENARYFSGFSGSDASLLITRKKAFFFTDGRYISQSAAQVRDMERVIYADKHGAIAEAIRSSGVKRVGFEDEVVSVASFNRLAAGCSGVTFVPLGDEVNALRYQKSAREIKALKKVISLSEKALREIMGKIRPGMRENRVAAMLNARMLELGAQDLAFDTIVASGPRGALPHGIAAARRIKSGDLVTIDWGAKLDGYHSDQTVTFGVGKLDGWQREIYSVVYSAQRAGIKACLAGAKEAEVDGVARRIIGDAGYGKYFTHGTGHGVGLAVHEGPRLSSRSKGILHAGDVVTVEPGIYLPGKGGVRLEDMVLVTEDKPRVLTTVSKKLKIL